MQRRTYVAGLASALTAGLAGCSALGSSGDGGGDDGDDGTDGTDNTDGNNSHGDGGNDSDGGNETDPGGEPASPSLVNGSFEDGLEGWTIGTDLPSEPGESDEPVDHGVETVTREASDGESSVECYISGVADDGTIWVEQEVDFGQVSTVEVDAYSRQESFNEIAMLAVFAGEKPEDGLEEEDFDRDENIEDHEGWKTYSYDVSDVSDTATLAVGMTVIWETEVRRLLDDVTVVPIEADQ